MNDINSKIKIWWQKVSTKEPTYNKKGLSPMHDWVFIFIVVQVLIVLCAVGSFYFYKAVDSGEFFAVDEETIQNEVKINIGLLQKTVEDINDREKSLEESKQKRGIPADPSR